MKKQLQQFLKEQHGTAGWETKLESFIEKLSMEERSLAYKRGRRAEEESNRRYRWRLNSLLSLELGLDPDLSLYSITEALIREAFEKRDERLRLTLFVGMGRIPCKDSKDETKKGV